MSSTNLKPTPYLVLGLRAREGPPSPYDLKRRVAATLGHVWSFPHTLLYTEPSRLADLGLVTERRERHGRRRRLFTITDSGLAGPRARAPPARGATARAGLARRPHADRGAGARVASGQAGRVRGGSSARRSGLWRQGLETGRSNRGTLAG